MTLIITILIILIAILGAPLFTVIAITAMVNHILTPGAGGMENVILEISKIADMPLLHSIPLFTFAGYLLAYSNASKRLVRFTEATIGWMPGGLAIVVIIACSIFTAFTGATGVTIVALGGLLMPALLSEKYEEKYSIGLITSSGSFGLLFPPSLPIIMFGVIASAGAVSGVTRVSIDELYIAGFIPGFLIILALSLHAMYKSRKFKVKKTKFSFKELLHSFLDFMWEIPLPILLFAGIFSGKLVISDAASLTVVYLIIVEVLIKRDIKIKDIPKIIKESLLLVGAILIILAVSLAATNYLIYAEVPQKLFIFIQKFITSKWVFLFLLNIFLLIVGCLMDIFSAIVVVVPLIIPIAESYNINLLHLGIIFLANLQIGYLTPPIGMNLFVAAIRFNKSIVTLYKASVPFIILLLITLFMITYIPDLSIWFKENPSIEGQWQIQDDNGMIDKISFKAKGKFIRKQGDLMQIMLNEPIYGSYEVTNHFFGKNKIVLKTNEKTEEFRYEIYNDGKMLLLNNLSENNKKFYKNNLAEPIGINTEKFIAKWQNNDNFMEFNFNKQVFWKNDDIEKQYGYDINKNKLILFEYSENNEIVKKLIYNYIFENDNLIISDKKESFTFKFTDSINDE